MSNAKKNLRVVEGTPCVGGTRHAALVDDDTGEVLRATHARTVASGEPLQPGEDLYYLDPDGRVLDTYEGPRTGPPMVASKAYRTGWDAVFGKRKDTNAELN